MNHPKADKPTERKGFTLIELLLVMLITSTLVLGINAAYRQAHLMWSSIESRRPIYHTARLVTETLREELSCLYFPPTTEEQKNTSFKLLTLPNETTELAFYTLTASWKGSLGSSRIAKVRYSFTRDTDTEETVLERFEQPCAGEKTIGAESSDVIVRGLSDFRLWAAETASGSSGELWRQSYSSNDTVPKALKVSLRWAATKDVPVIDFETSIAIPCQMPLSP